MQFRELEQHFKTHQLITLQDIRNAFTDINRVQISRWIKKGWLFKIQNGKYVLSSRRNNIDKELLADELKNSYISLEYALNYYNLIPEIPHVITSITTERTESIKTPMGTFSYSHIMPSLFTGYKLIDSKLEQRKIRFASPTKALFDYIYIKGPSYSEGFSELRLNLEEIKAVYEQEKFEEWKSRVSNPALISRLENFKDYIKAND